MSEKDTTADTAWTARAQVGCHGFTNVGRQRQLRPAPTLAPNGDPTVIPIDVIQAQRNDLAGPQTQSGEQQQNGIVPLSIRSATLAPIEDPLDCASRQELRHGGNLLVSRLGSGAIARWLALVSAWPGVRAARRGVQIAVSARTLAQAGVSIGRFWNTRVTRLKHGCYTIWAGKKIKKNRTEAEATSSKRYPRYDSGRTHPYYPIAPACFPRSALSQLFSSTAIASSDLSSGYVKR